VITVLLVDDHALVRHGLRAYLETEAGISVVADVPTLEAAGEALSGQRPDVALVDLVLGADDGVALAAIAARVSPHTRLVALTGFGEDHRVRRALDAGFAGYLLKTATAEEVLAAIRRVARGQTALDPAVTAPVLGGAPGGDLTARERDVIALIAKGASNAEISAALAIGEKTVKTHVSNLLAKAQVPDRTRLALWAVRQGLG
jgi:NarL family two-component system response regulator LiaR